MPEANLFRIVVLIIILFAWFVRLYSLGDLPLRWDEGWSLGLASISPQEIARVTALDVHPPLYYLLLKPWLTVGMNEFTLRFFSVIFGLLSVPLAYTAGTVWAGRPTGLFAALLVAFSPPLIYYSQVTRMFALSATSALLVIYGGLLMVRPRADFPANWPQWAPIFLFILGGAISLYTFYYTAFVVLALFLYLVLTAHNRLKTILASFATLFLGYLPWIIYALPPLLSRVATRIEARAPVDLLLLLQEGFFSLSLAYGEARPLGLLVLAITVLAIVIAGRRRWEFIFLPGFAVFLTVFGAAFGSQAHMFAARYTIAAAPALALLLAWALAILSLRSRLLSTALLLLLATAIWPTRDFVYSKPLEMTGHFNPAGAWRALRAAGAEKDDIVFFNVLSLAGTYERYRTIEDPAWSYALRWDPVIEPLDTATARISEAASEYPRLWFVLYKGTFAANFDLKASLDQSLYPAFGEWKRDTLYLLYLAPPGNWQELPIHANFEEGVVLEKVQVPNQVELGEEIGVRLVWRAETEIEHTYKVFVHLYDGRGTLIAQHDSFPVNELRPTSSWEIGEEVEDRHGLIIPADAAFPLVLKVGLYDPETGERLLVNGQDAIEIASYPLPA